MSHGVAYWFILTDESVLFSGAGVCNCDICADGGELIVTRAGTKHGYVVVTQGSRTQLEKKMKIHSSCEIEDFVESLQAVCV